jgi:dihydrofolate reductase
VVSRLVIEAARTASMSLGEIVRLHQVAWKTAFGGQGCCVTETIAVGGEPRLLYSATMSLDGYISGPAGDQSWLARHLGPNPLIDSLMDDIGALLVGARTFGGDDPNRGTEDEGAFSGQWHGPQVVLTHNPPAVPAGSDIRYVDDLKEAVQAAKAAARGKKYVNVLGADTARQCLEAGMLDEILVLVAPVLLGDGTPLFRSEGGVHVDLRPMSVSAGDSVTNLWFQVGSLSAYPPPATA